MAERREAQTAALEIVTEAAFNGVLAALDRRNLTIEKFPGPILIGIIAWPELSQSTLLREQMEKQTRGTR